jgi:hypothetical protein
VDSKPFGPHVLYCSLDAAPGVTREQAPATPILSGTTLHANFCEIGTRDEYSFTVGATIGNIDAQLKDVPSYSDYDLWLHDAVSPNAIASSAHSGCVAERIVYRPTKIGKYYLLVNAYVKGPLAATQPYSLTTSYH